MPVRPTGPAVRSIGPDAPAVTLIGVLVVAALQQRAAAPEPEMTF
jgi:hypothetical protein